MSFQNAAPGVAPANERFAHRERTSHNFRVQPARRSLCAATVLCLFLVASPFSAGATGARANSSAQSSQAVHPAPAATRPPQEPIVINGSVVTIVEFSDFGCPYCAQMVSVIDQLKNADPGKVQVIVKPFPLAIHPGSGLAQEAVLAARAQGKFWEMYHLLFENQEHLDRESLLAYARKLGLNVPQFQKALDSHEFGPAVRESMAEGLALGVDATPTFFLNGQKLSGVQSLAAMQQQVQAALHATEPASGREEIVTANSPVRGSPESPVTIVEYADFQCPYCSKAEYSVAQVLREYPGKVKLVFKNFPLDFHENAMPAARAAMAAGEQGKFWEMHDLLFSHQGSIHHDDLFALAKGLGLDMGRFARDFDSDQVRAAIEADRTEARKRGVDGTPTFYIDGAEMVGALGASQFEAMIDRSLRAKGIEPARIPQASDGGPSRGPEHAPVTVLWYSDVTSPLAIGASKLIDQITAAYPSDVRVVFKNRPLEFHQDAELAHEALMAAAAQGKFWAMHRLLLEHQNALTANDLMDYAGKAGLDTNKFYADLTGGAFRDQVQHDVAEAHQSGINGVPVFFVNGKRLDGVQTLAGFKAVLEEQIQHGRVAAVRE
jgi:protein-disulfide isomerase